MGVGQPYSQIHASRQTWRGDLAVTTDAPHFDVGETAVLLHSSGARLFTVGRILEDPPTDEGHYMVAERIEKPFLHEFSVSSINLVKVSSRESAIELCGILNFIQDVRRREVAEVEQRWKNVQKRTVADFRVENF
jgi:hypothetical protein